MLVSSSYHGAMMMQSPTKTTTVRNWLVSKCKDLYIDQQILLTPNKSRETPTKMTTPSICTSKPTRRASTSLSSPPPLPSSSASSSANRRTSLSSAIKYSNKTTKPRDNHEEYVQKKAYVAMQGAFLAVLDCLESEGVSRASTDELRGIRGMRGGKFAWVLGRSQEYAECCLRSSSRHASSSSSFSTDHNETVVVGPPPLSLPPTPPSSTSTSSESPPPICDLIMNAWSCLCNYHAVQYKQAYKDFHQLRMRRCQERDLMMMAHDERQQTFDTKMMMGMTTSPTANNITNNNSNPQQSLECALARQVALAEECCSSQKGMILAKSWVNRLVHVI